MSEDHTISKRDGYGDSIRLQLRRLGMSQKDLAEAAGLSRPTISRAINHDELTEATAEKIRLALEFRKPGSAATRPVPSRSSAPSTATGRRRRISAALCSADDLEGWADSRAAQSLLPELVRRLILASPGEITQITIRAGDGVALRGWDGYVRSETRHPFIPKGQSAWEMGVGGDPRSKAAGDLRKRTRDPGHVSPGEATFVFVTPRRWEDKEKWAARKERETGWSAIRVIDADDLETWLIESPSVHVWISRLVGTLPGGVIDLEGFWEAWSRATDPALSVELLSVGRTEVISRIQDHAKEAGGALRIVAESRDEAVAMFFVALDGLAESVKDSLLSRALVVEDGQALQHLVSSPTPLVLILNMDPAQDLAATAMRAGHMVVVPLAQGEAHEGDGFTIPPLDRFRFEELLREAGIADDHARKLSGLARRSLTAFRRQQSVAGRAAVPEWARPQNARSLLPALLVGSWNDQFPGDREVISTLARGAYEDFADRLVAWSSGHDPALRRKGNHWYLVSREDSWVVLARYLREEDLERFRSVAIRCLSEVDPKYGLPLEKRWMAGVLADPPRHSPDVRRGVAATLALLGARADSQPNGSPHQTAAVLVVRELLDLANNDWRLWASLSPLLPLLAEAAPDEFLDAIEAGLSGGDPVLRYMFTDGPESGLFGPSSPHTGLLWALETLAWSTDYLGRVSMALAGLDRVDPGSALRSPGERTGRLANRPLASLKSLYRSWLPQTSSSLDLRLAALDSLQARDADVAWAVALSMLPESHGSASSNAVPRFREWAAAPFKRIPNHEVVASWRAALDRLLAWVGSVGASWSQLLEATTHLPHDYAREVFEALNSLEAGGIEGRDREQIWEALRELVAQHRMFRSAKWALPPEVVDRLDAIRSRFEPSDEIERHRWLFSFDPCLPDGGAWDEVPFEERMEAVDRARAAAVRDILEARGAGALVQLAERVDRPDQVGFIAGKELDSSHIDDAFIAELLSEDASASSRFAFGLAWGRTTRDGAGWLSTIIEDAALDLSDEQKGILLRLLPASPETWDMVDRIGPRASRSYWRQVGAFELPAEHLAWAADHLIAADRPFAAVELVSMHLRGGQPIAADLILRVLSAAVEPRAQHDEPGSSFSYWVGALLDELESAGADPKEIARLEWATLPALRSFERRPKVLHQFMATDPDFFVELVGLAFRSEHEEPQDLTEEEQRKASLAYDLLESWSRIPGTTERGVVDASELRLWLEAARSRLTEEGLLRSGDRIIGQVFSRSPSDPDGAWPCAQIRRAIEDLSSSRLEEGLYLGIVNSRGVTTRLPQDGGRLERGLAEKYDGLATAISSSSPHTASVLRKVARSYRRDAEREDLEADLSQDRGD